jgi:mannose-6-phosphate isomerase class I
MLIAISDDFEAMCGFRPANEIVAHFNNYTELSDLCNNDLCNKFIRLYNDNQNAMLEAVLADCLKELMNQNNEMVC